MPFASEKERQSGGSQQNPRARSEPHANGFRQTLPPLSPVIGLYPDRKGGRCWRLRPEQSPSPLPLGKLDKEREGRRGLLGK